MRRLRKMLIVALVIFATAWLGATWEIEQRRQAAANYHRRFVEPHTAKLQSNSPEIDPAGRILLDLRFDVDEFTRVWSEYERLLDRYHDARIWRSSLQIGGALGVVALLVGLMIRGAVLKQRYDQPNRPIGAFAGTFIRELIESGHCFVAKSGDRLDDLRIEIDGQRAQVRFHNFTFVTRFAGNPKQRFIALGFEEILAGWLFQYDKALLQLRTTSGRLDIPEAVQPFPELARYLVDIAEFNRLDPERYRAALAREPVLRTTWYGWAILASTVLTIGCVIWQLFL